VLDCAAGTGQVAVGLALRGFAVTATDASGEMIERTRALAVRRRVALEAATCAWAALAERRWSERFDAVLCVGNSLPHAEGRAGRRAALAGMAHCLRPGGLVLVTSRNWERLRAARPTLEIAEELLVREGRSGLAVRSWTIPDDPAARHELDAAVVLLGPGQAVTTVSERMPFWPFTHGELDEDLVAAGLAPASSTYAPDVDRYLVAAHRPPAAPTRPPTIEPPARG
jgi:SAM-dependent methyltransferase